MRSRVAAFAVLGLNVTAFCFVGAAFFLRGRTGASGSSPNRAGRARPTADAAGGDSRLGGAGSAGVNRRVLRRALGPAPALTRRSYSTAVARSRLR